MEDKTTTKKCAKCQLDKSRQDFVTDKKRADGLNSWCKLCHQEYQREYDKKRREKNKLKNSNLDFNGTKKCPNCQEIKIKTEFSIQKDSDSGLTSWCKKCTNQKGKQKRMIEKPKARVYTSFKEVDFKVCPKCKISKSRSNFHKSKHMPTGLTSHCKDCVHKQSKVKREENKQKNESGQIDLTGFKTCYNCKEEKLKTNFYISKDRSDGLAARCKKCEQKRTIIRLKEKSKSDPAFKLRVVVGNSIRKQLKRQNLRKDHPTWSKLPYTPKELREHLERQFDENMNWDNYGTYWQIDHIYPQSKLIYDSLDNPNFIKCWGLDNLRPLEASENNKKRDKII